MGMMLRIAIVILLIALSMHGDAEAFSHGKNVCAGGTNYILGTGCSDILLDGTDKLTAA